MIDVHYYADRILSSSDNFKKYLGKNNYKTLNSFIYSLKNIDLEWINNDEIKKNLYSDVQTVVLSLENEKLTTKELVSKLDDLELDLASDHHFSAFEFVDYKNGKCPQCGQKKVYIPKKGTGGAIICNRRDNCGYTTTGVKYLMDNHNKKFSEAFEIVANTAGTSLEEISAQNEIHKEDFVPKAKKEKKKVKAVKKEDIKYLVFDSSHKYTQVNYGNFLPTTKVYEKLDEVQRWKVFVTAIYDFSLNTKQWGKDNYYKSIGIDRKNPLLKEKMQLVQNKLGYLFKTDIKPLIEYLINDCKFTKEDLIEYGLIDDRNRFKTSIEEGLVVIPNFDMYTNMVTALKFRKTKLRTWIDKESKETKTDKNKEPEFSYKRIAHPLPYHLTRESLLNKELIFRFFEGQKDLHSMPFKQRCCDIAIPGVDGIQHEAYGLFKGRVVELFFDQDNAGQIGAIGSVNVVIESLNNPVYLKKLDKLKIEYKILEKNLNIKIQKFPNNKQGIAQANELKESLKSLGMKFTQTESDGLLQKLSAAGAIVVNKSWDKDLGSDVNEVLQNGNILTLMDL